MKNIFIFVLTIILCIVCANIVVAVCSPTAPTIPIFNFEEPTVPGSLVVDLSEFSPETGLW